MKLTIDRTQTIGDLKKEFNSLYPYLKLEFFNTAHDVFEVSAARFIIHDETLHLDNVSSIGITSGIISVGDTITVNQLETQFEKEFGLHIQVLRRSGNVWLTTTITDSLILKEQNAKGMSSLEVHEPEEKMDYREKD